MVDAPSAPAESNTSTAGATPSTQPMTLVPAIKRQFSAYAPAFTGASFGRRGKNWLATGSGPASITLPLSTLRNRMRDLDRNDPWTQKLGTVFATNIVSTGFTPLCKSPDSEFATACMELWPDFVEDADASGMTTLHGLVWQATLAIFMSGEVLFQQLNNNDPDLAVPLQYQLLEPDYLDHTYSMPLNNGRRILQGIELDENGKRLAYHIHAYHPGETFLGNGSSERIVVPADQMLHSFRSRRPGQVRGYPLYSSALMRAMDVAEYDEAELTRKKIGAMMMLFIKQQMTEGGIGDILQAQTETGADGKRQTISEIVSGMATYLNPGEEVQFNEAIQIDGQYTPFLGEQHRAMAAAGDATYEQATGDLRGVNFSSIRAGLNEIQRNYETIQHHVIVPQIYRPIWRRFIERAILAGRIKPPSDFMTNRHKHMRVDWLPPGWAYVNPVDEENAALMAIRNGTASRQQIVGKRGYDVRQIDQEQSEDNARADKLGLRFDSDARNAKTGPAPEQKPVESQSDDGGKTTSKEEE